MSTTPVPARVRVATDPSRWADVAAVFPLADGTHYAPPSEEFPSGALLAPWEVSTTDGRQVCPTWLSLDGPTVGAPRLSPRDPGARLAGRPDAREGICCFPRPDYLRSGNLVVHPPDPYGTTPGAVPSPQRPSPLSLTLHGRTLAVSGRAIRARREAKRRALKAGRDAGLPPETLEVIRGAFSGRVDTALYGS